MLIPSPPNRTKTSGRIAPPFLPTHRASKWSESEGTKEGTLARTHSWIARRPATSRSTPATTIASGGGLATARLGRRPSTLTTGCQSRRFAPPRTLPMRYKMLCYKGAVLRGGNSYRGFQKIRALHEARTFEFL